MSQVKTKNKKVRAVPTVLALYYKDGNYKSLIRFFNNLDEVDAYIHDEYFGEEPWDEWNTDSRNDEIKRYLRIEEVPIVDILNAHHSDIKNLETACEG